MRTSVYLVHIPQPYAALLEIEAAASDRTPEAHVLHILGNRYDNLIRACTCGYFLYVSSDDLKCDTCKKPCCPYCSLPQDNRDMCFDCAHKKGIDTTGKGGYRAAPEGKV